MGAAAGGPKVNSLTAREGAGGPGAGAGKARPAKASKPCASSGWRLLFAPIVGSTDENRREGAFARLATGAWADSPLTIVGIGPSRISAGCYLPVPAFPFAVLLFAGWLLAGWVVAGVVAPELLVFCFVKLVVLKVIPMAKWAVVRLTEFRFP